MTNLVIRTGQNKRLGKQLIKQPIRPEPKPPDKVATNKTPIISPTQSTSNINNNNHIPNTHIQTLCYVEAPPPNRSLIILSGTLDTCPVTILIDSGASDNFIDSS